MLVIRKMHQKHLLEFVCFCVVASQQLLCNCQHLTLTGYCANASKIEVVGSLKDLLAEIQSRSRRAGPDFTKLVRVANFVSPLQDTGHF